MLTSVRDRWFDRVRRSLANSDHAAAKDIELTRQQLAVASTAAFVDEHMSRATPIGGSDAYQAMLAVLQSAMDHVSIDGLTVEFGVATGTTLRLIAARRPGVFGFDSFEGLPADWRSGYGVGHFAQEPPEVPGATLVRGWFEDSLPAFLEAHPEPWAFVHLDADLYSSTKTVFDLAFDRFRCGTIILFDEYFNYPGWQQHEHRAFQEFLRVWAGGFEYVNYNALHEQVTVVLT